MVLDHGCKVKKAPSLPERDPHTRSITRVAIPNIMNTYQPFTHANCPENQLKSFVSRVAGLVPHPTPKSLKELRLQAKLLALRMPTTVQSDLYEMPNLYSGAKRKRYMEAVENYLNYNITKRDASIKFFVKADKLNPVEKVNPDPRAIQFRDPKYCVVLGSYLKPIEHHIYLTKFGCKGVHPSRSIAKGLNALERGQLFMNKVAQFTDPVFVSLDASRFDKHVSYELLQIEHHFYTLCNPDPIFARLLSWQLINKGYSDLGMVYRVRGRRMSGDMNTAAGNCLLMLLMVTTYFRLISVNKYDVLDDGDDIVVIIERTSLPTVETTVKNIFETFGMSMKVEGIVDDPYKVVFCKSNIIEYDLNKFKFVRSPTDVMSKSLCGTKHWSNLIYRRRVISSIATCELFLNLGTPILQAYAVALRRNVGGNFDPQYLPDGLLCRLHREERSHGKISETIEPVPITSYARDSFYRAFGISSLEQIRLEEQLSAWTFDILNTTHIGIEYDPRWEKFNLTNNEVYRL